jgi:hypothetical protein
MMIESRVMRWSRHVAGRREDRNAYKILVGRRNRLGDLNIHQPVILKLIAKLVSIELSEDRF